MKKTILLFAVLLAATCAFAQSTSVADASVVDVIYNFVISYIPVKVLTIILTIAWIFEQIIPSIKWTPANSTLALIWNVLKKVFSFLAGKKK